MADRLKGSGGPEDVAREGFCRNEDIGGTIPGI
jgi:hypothetical protein